MDHSTNRRATILDILKIDIRKLLETTEEYKVLEVINQTIKFIDYHYLLAEKELGLFDKAIIRLFDERQTFNPNIHTHITFTSSTEHPLKKMEKAVHRLVALYHNDDNDRGELDLAELEALNKRDYWQGRTWNFNNKHQLWKMKDPENHFSYSVSVYYDSYEEGFTLRIFSFNNLISHFDV